MSAPDWVHTVPPVPTDRPREAAHRRRPGRRPGRRGILASAIAGVLLIVTGGLVARSGLGTYRGPDGAVLGFFAALARGDSSAALAYASTAPTGNTALLTDPVLQEQNRIATPSDVRVLDVQGRGDRRTVEFSYRLFGDEVDDRSTVIEQDGTWALVSAAVPVRYAVGQAAHRMTLAGAAIPAQPVLTFPGAAPIRFDTPNLELAPPARVVRLSSPGTLALAVRLSGAGRQAVEDGLAAAVQHCLSASDPSCPTADSEDGEAAPRIVPGTLRGTPTSDVVTSTKAVLADDPDGRVDISGTLGVEGRYQALDFQNRPAENRGPVTLAIKAHCFATDPAAVGWDGS